MDASAIKTFDDLADWYADWVQSTSWIHGVLEANLPALWDTEPPQVVLDVACGEGIFSRMLAGAGHTVVGIDQSSRLLAFAEERSVYAHPSIVFRVDDAQTLETCADAAFDGALCVLALMDIPELGAGVWGRATRRSIGRMVCDRDHASLF
jgi:ubiquinone/menaquinone biosynthesis C-methylase UbiE